MKEDSSVKEEDIKDTSIINSSEDKDTSIINSSEDKDTSISTNSSEANAEICNQIVESIVSESEQIVKEKYFQHDGGKLIKLLYLLEKKLFYFESEFISFMFYNFLKIEFLKYNT